LRDYDPVGNLLRLTHQAAVGNWTRTYAYNENSLIEPARKSNRLSQTALPTNAGAPAEQYSYDAHGNFTQMPHLPMMQWDFKDQLSASSRQAVNAGQPETTYYVYDTGGQRARKVTEQASGTRKNERFYIGGYEVYRELNGGGAVALQRDSLHVMDDKQRIAIVETQTVNNGPAIASPVPVQRYQLANHLGSAILELDDASKLITYEEYAPFGSSRYQAVRSQTETSKRYRYTGKERDEESGLYYHGVRYNAPWIGRWISADPKGLIDGVCLYSYCSDNPVALHDPSGTQGTSPPPGMIGNDPRIGALWEKAAVETLGPRLHAKTYSEVVTAFQAEVANRVAAKGGWLGSNRAAGTAINYARTSYAQVRARFGRLAAQEGISLNGLQVHHTFGEIAQAPGEALTTTNLMFARGNAASVGSGHNFAHKVSEAQAAGAKNPGQQVAAELEARGIKPDVPELSPTIQNTTPPKNTPGAATTAKLPTAAATSLAEEHPTVPLAPSQVPAPAAPGRLMRAGAWAADTLPRVARIAGQIVTVVGAVEEANRTYELENRNNRGWLNAGAMWTATAVAGVLAGVVDDALAATATAASGSPAPVMESWDQYGSGPVQHAAGEAIRGILDWGAKHGL
jgi:RHS repeat-associated protein